MADLAPDAGSAVRIDSERLQRVARHVLVHRVWDRQELQILVKGQKWGRPDAGRQRRWYRDGLSAAIGDATRVVARDTQNGRLAKSVDRVDDPGVGKALDTGGDVQAVPICDGLDRVRGQVNVRR